MFKQELLAYNEIKVTFQWFQCPNRSNCSFSFDGAIFDCPTPVRSYSILAIRVELTEPKNIPTLVSAPLHMAVNWYCVNRCLFSYL